MDSNVAAVLIDLHKTGKYEGFIRGGQAPLEKSKKTGLRLSRIARDIVGANNTEDEALVVVANTFEDEIWAFPEGAFFDKGTPLEEIAERVTASGFPDWNPSVGDAVSESEIGLFFFSAENGQELLLLLDGNDDPRHQEYFKHALNRKVAAEGKYVIDRGVSAAEDSDMSRGIAKAAQGLNVGSFRVRGIAAKFVIGTDERLLNLRGYKAFAGPQECYLTDGCTDFVLNSFNRYISSVVKSGYVNAVALYDSEFDSWAIYLHDASDNQTLASSYVESVSMFDRRRITDNEWRHYLRLGSARVSDGQMSLRPRYAYIY